MAVFPPELAALKQWICWRLEHNAKSGKDDKVPYCPKNGKRASSMNPETWTDYRAALAAKDKYLYTGIGFVFVKDAGIVGVDMPTKPTPAPSKTAPASSVC